METAAPIIIEGLISVIMSNYNTPLPYLKKAIDSILAQTYTTFEFIIVDDGSTDDSPEVIRSCTDPRIRLICNGENRGLAYSLNRAMEHCQGEFIARMDSDDISLPDRFAKQISFMREHPDVIVCGAWANTIDKNDQDAGWSIQGTISDREEYRICLLFGNTPTIVHPSAFLNRRLLLKHGLQYDVRYRHAQDYQLWVRCAQIAECRIIPEVMVLYRVHDESVSRKTKSKQMNCAYRIIQEQLDQLLLTLPEELKQSHFLFVTDSHLPPFDRRLKKWLAAIIRANKTYRVYDRRKLKRTVWTSWGTICWREMAKRPGFGRTAEILCSMPPLSLAEFCRLLMKKMKKLKRLKKIEKK